MTITATDLRKNIYNILDSVWQTGKPIEVERDGHILKISAEKKVGKLAQLKKSKPVLRIKGDPADLKEIDWSKEWKP